MQRGSRWRGRRAAALLLGVFAVPGAGCGPAERPNVILVVLDTLRADHLDDYGYGRPTGVGLARFRSHSTRFANCTSSSSWTVPSIASLLTGLFTARHRVNAHGAKLTDEAWTLAEKLGEAGWTTAGFSFNAEIARVSGFAQGFDRFDDHLGKVRTYPDFQEMIDRVRDWLDTAPREPFFLYLQPMNIHGPYRVPKAQRDVLLGRPPSRFFVYQLGPMNAIMRRGDSVRRASVSRVYLESLTDQYDTAVRYTTDRLAELFALLERRGLYDRSLIVVTADHGEELFEHGGFSHAYSLHREVLHVPLYVKRPRQTTARVVEAPVTLMDVYPTVVELLGLPEDRAVDGHSLVAYLEGTRAAGPGRPQLSQVAWEGRCVARAIRKGRFKLIEIESNYEGLEAVRRLYDIVDDPGERVDLSEREPEHVARLHAELDARFAGFASRALPEPPNILDQLDRDRLEALGYGDAGTAAAR